VNKKFYISRDVTFQENESYYNNLEKKINTKNQPNKFTLPHFYDPERDESSMEYEMENEEETQGDEEENEVEPETMPPRRSTRAPQPSTRLHDFCHI
jgi:hypothetical protein